MKSNIIRNIVVVLLIVIVAEAGYLVYLKVGVNKVKQADNTPPAQNSISPTRSARQVLEDGSSAFVFEGKVSVLEELQDEKYKYRIKILQSDGKLENVQFEEANLDIMTVLKNDPETGEDRVVSYNDIQLNDQIKIQMLYDPVEQSMAVNKIEAYKILINIL